MYKIILLLIIFSFLSFSNDLHTSLDSIGVETDYINHAGENKRIIVKREIDPACKNIHISNDVFWKGKYASQSVLKACKSTFITSAGKTIFPMQIHKDIETYGEMEVMTFIKNMQQDESMLFIDTRDEEWYEYRTIPGAVNIHYAYMMMPKVFEEEYKASLVKLGVFAKNKSFDFSQAKTILLFCNGAWCSQSPKMIKALLSLGYPPKKIKWYRGGMDDWLGLSMTTTRK
jgi:rhodanese-related sulfurtransferase